MSHSDELTRRAWRDPTFGSKLVEIHADEHLQSGEDPIDLAKATAAGLMSAGDKIKLDGLSQSPGVSSHDELDNVSAYQHHAHAAPEVKTWNGTDTAWTLAETPANGVTLFFKPVDGAYLMMDPEADYTLVGAVVTPTVKPGNGDKTRMESYEYAGTNS